MGNVKPKGKEPSVQEIERNDPILAEVRRARAELAREIEEDPEKVHERALRHAKEFGFKIAKLKPVKPKHTKD